MPSSKCTTVLLPGLGQIPIHSGNFFKTFSRHSIFGVPTSAEPMVACRFNEDSHIVEIYQPDLRNTADRTRKHTLTVLAYHCREEGTYDLESLIATQLPTLHSVTATLTPPALAEERVIPHYARQNSHPCSRTPSLDSKNCSRRGGEVPLPFFPPPESPHSEEEETATEFKVCLLSFVLFLE